MRSERETYIVLERARNEQKRSGEASTRSGGEGWNKQERVILPRNEGDADRTEYGSWSSCEHPLRLPPQPAAGSCVPNCLLPSTSFAQPSGETAREGESE